MKNYCFNPNTLMEEYNEIAHEAQVLAIFSIGHELQRKGLINLESHISNFEERKKQFAEEKKENEANLYFCLISCLESVAEELRMLLAMKEDKMAAAWHHLVIAQTTFAQGVRNYPFTADHLEGYAQRLAEYESLLFPGQIFASVGGLVTKSLCSICKADYGICDHVKGLVYMGELCVREVHEMKVEEGSIVENPANKLCRILSITVNGLNIDPLTRREVNSDDNGTVSK